MDNQYITLFEKTCGHCGNACKVSGSVNRVEKSTDINTYENPLAVFDGATCGLVADTLVKCHCGKRYKMPSRKAWSMLQFLRTC